MKKLSLFLFAILILGCGTETTVVEEPAPVVKEDDPIPAPQIVGGNVLDGDVDADPELLNQDGIILEFSEPLSMYTAEIGLWDIGHLDWSPLHIVDHWNIGNQVHLIPAADSPLLEYDTKYWVSVYAQGRACNGANTEITFRTKPR